MLFVKLERDNNHDKHAVIEDGITVDYVPREICKNVYYFMKQDGNVAFCETTGECCNCGTGFGVQIPCTFKFYGHRMHVVKLKCRQLDLYNDHCMRVNLYTLCS